MIQKRGLTDGNERIELIQSNVNSLDFTLMLTGITIDTTSILGIEWTSNDGIVICRKAREICHHNFGSYGTHKIGAKIYLADKTSREVTREINVEEPLRLTRHVIVT